MINIQLHNDCPATDTIVPNQFIDALCRQQTGNLLRYIYIYYGASILMHQIVQFLKLLTNLTIQKWTFSVHCVTGRKKDSSLWRKPPTVNCAESVFFRFRKIPQTRKRHLPLLPRLLFFGRNTSIRCRGKRFLLPACESTAGTADPPLYAG